MKKYKSTSIEYSYFIYAPDGKTIIGDVFIGIYKRHKQKKNNNEPRD